MQPAVDAKKIFHFPHARVIDVVCVVRYVAALVVSQPSVDVSEKGEALRVPSREREPSGGAGTSAKVRSLP